MRFLPYIRFINLIKPMIKTSKFVGRLEEAAAGAIAAGRDESNGLVRADRKQAQSL
jgi:hypothetical protein